MALPVIPIALAAGAFALARNVHISPVDQRVEDRLDDVSEGFAAHRAPDKSQVNAAYRWKRIIRVGQSGPGVEVDLSMLGRVKLSKVKK